jgi:hypothetical protein
MEEINGSALFLPISCTQRKDIKRLQDEILNMALKHNMVGNRIPKNYKQVQDEVIQMRSRTALLPVVAFRAILQRVFNDLVL